MNIKRHYNQLLENNRRSPSWIKTATLLVLMMAGLFSNQLLFAQCCLTNSLVISTGYDPTTAGAVAIPNPDPKWTVASLSPHCIMRGGAIPTAYAVGGGTGGPTPSASISCLNIGCFVDNIPMENDWMTLQRCFYLCHAANVTFNVNIQADDWISALNIDGTIALGAPSFPTPAAPGAAMVPVNVNQTFFLSAGTHCINVRVHNWYYNAYQCFNFALNGTISTPGLDIMKENGGCTPSWPFCSIPPITGPNSCCVGGSKTLTNAFAGGTWSSGSTGIAYINPITGVYTGLAPGTSLITYTDPCGRTTTYLVTIHPIPSISGGVSAICMGGSTTFLGTPSGGTWSSLNPGVATVSGAGFVSSAGPAGTSMITYTSPAGCVNTRLITVNPNPVISPFPSSVCVGSTILLGVSIPGGTWSSSNTSLATIGSGSGVVTGINPGTVIITYRLPTTCFATKIITVNPNPVIPSGSVCIASNITLPPSILGGTWISGTPIVANVNLTTGIVTGNSPGTTVITYTLPTGCKSMSTVTVNPSPDPITGLFSLCAGGFTTTLSDATPGGTWSSSNTGVATIGSSSGIVTSGSAGTTIITYTLGTGCFTTAVFLVEPTPAVTGTHAMCLFGPAVTISAIPSGGTWISSNPLVAAIGLSTGTITSAAPGAVTITYTSPAGCVGYYTFTVNPLPDPISGPAGVCVGSTITVSTLSSGGTWSSSATGIATIHPLTGLISGILPGTATISYVFPTGCYTTRTVVVHPLPTFTYPTLCVGSTYAPTFVSSLGGTWSSSNPIVALVNPLTGDLSCMTVGTAIISYTSAAGCLGVAAVTVNPLPEPVIGINPSPSPDICVGQSTMIYADPLSVVGCTLAWFSSNTAVATVTAGSGTSATITGVSAGTAIITCVATNSVTGCTGSFTFTITVHALPLVSITSVPAAVPVPGGGSLVMTCTGAELTAHSSTTVSYLWTPTTFMTPPSGTTPVVTVTPPVLTSYTVTVVDTAAPHCSNWASIDVMMIKNRCVCDAQSKGMIVKPFALSGTITNATAGLYTAGNYYMQNNVTISGLPGDIVHLTGCVIFIDPGLTIDVAPGVTLILDDCHLFCCNPDMWKGIVLNGGTPGWYGRIELLNNTMIEDAKIAINVVPGPVWPAGIPVPPPPPPGTLIINSHGATFNKNTVGISVRNFTDPTVPVLTPTSGYSYPVVQVPCYPFVVENTVFTSRNFYSYNTPGPVTIPTSWPYTKPGTNTLPDGLKTPWTPAGPYDAPHNIDNPMACVTGAYSPSPCNDLLPADKGIELADVGVTSGSLGTAVYSGIVIGSVPVSPLNDELNMFDNLQYGIFARNTNLTPRNAVYMHLNGIANSGGAMLGVGVYAENTAPGNPLNQYSLWLYGSDGTLAPKKGGVVATSSSFYDCNAAVIANEYYHTKAEFATIMSNQSPSTIGTLLGSQGYSLQSSNYYNVQLNYNKIHNIANGLSFTATPPSATPLFGQIEMQGNVIAATNTSALPLLGEYVQQAIRITGIAGPAYAMNIVPGSQVNIEHNDMEHVFNGVNVSGFNMQTQPVVCNNNIISLIEDLIFPPSAAQTGVLYKTVNPGYIRDNNITGPGSNIPTPPSHTGGNYGLPVIEGVHVDDLIGSGGGISIISNVGCNTVKNVNTGFYFENYNGVEWMNNTMDHNAYGYVLNGTIGSQLGVGAFSDNNWLPASGFWTAVGPTPNYQTYTIGAADPMASPLYVNGSSPVLYPLEHGTDAGSSFGAYIPGLSVIAFASGTHPTCPVIPPTSVGFRQGNSGGDEDRNGKIERPAIVNANAQDYMLYPNPSDGNITIKQQVADMKSVKAEICNAVGQVIYKGDFNFSNGTSHFTMQNKVPGIYLLKLTDNTSGQFTIKFTIK